MKIEYGWVVIVEKNIGTEMSGINNILKKNSRVQKMQKIAIKEKEFLFLTRIFSKWTWV